MYLMLLVDDRKMLLNMASKLDIPYYAARLDLPNNETSNEVGVRFISTCSRQVYDKWMYEKEQVDSVLVDGRTKKQNYSSKCQFPRDATRVS